MNRVKSREPRRITTSPAPNVVSRPRGPKAGAPARIDVRDELSTGRGLALRSASFRADGGAAATKVSRTSEQDELRSKVDDLHRELARLNRLMSTSARAVAAAYERGGAAAAAAELNRQTAGLNPNDAAAVVTGSQAVIDELVADLARTSEDADGGQTDQGSAQVAFDQTLADLNVALSRGASTELGQAAVGRVASAITAGIDENGMGRWDEALGNTLVGGPYFDSKSKVDPAGIANADSTLAQAVVRQLHDQGEEGRAHDILRNVKDSLSALNHSSERVEEQLAPLTAQLAAHLEALGPDATEAQRRAVVERFRRENPEYVSLTRFLEVRPELVDQLFDFTAKVPHLNEGLRGLFDHTLRELVEGMMSSR